MLVLLFVYHDQAGVGVGGHRGDVPHRLRQGNRRALAGRVVQLVVQVGRNGSVEIGRALSHFIAVADHFMQSLLSAMVHIVALYELLVRARQTGHPVGNAVGSRGVRPRRIYLQ